MAGLFLKRPEETKYIMSRGQAPTQRQLRVGEEIRHVLAEVIERGGLRDPAVRGKSITVSEVRVSVDLKNATAFVIPLGGEHTTEIVAALSRASGYLRGELGRRLRLRAVPRLSFEPDISFDQASHVDHLLRDPHVARDLAKGDPDDGAPS